MIDPTNFRRERIEKLLHELRYEVERGMLEKEIDETMGFRFYVPLCRAIPDGVVFCEFRTRPIHRYMMNPGDIEPRLRISWRYRERRPWCWLWILDIKHEQCWPRNKR